MCGIAGIYAYHPAAPAVDRTELTRIRDHMAARGPDGKGAWYSENGRVGFGNRRLSIIDLSESGAQPMVSAAGKLVVTFNGEIYNYRELRDALEAKGRVFHSQSDTEVLLHLYAEKGEGLVHDLRGMFAFAIWDAEKQCLLLARDPYGIKPLYYVDDGGTVRFASQVKAVLAGSKVSREPDPAGWAGFYLFGSVPEPFTIHQNIRALPAGATLRVNATGPQLVEHYYSIASTYCDAEQEALHVKNTVAEQQEQIRVALLDSVRHHLVADVPVGAFLSAGIDSGALVGLMRDAGQNDISTVTLSFNEFRGRADDEVPLAADVARLYGTRHTTRVVTEREFHADLPKILEAMDQPTIDGVNTWFVSKAAHELGLKVAISGLGGDELFGGYPSFKDVPRWVKWLGTASRVPLAGAAVRRAFIAAGWPSGVVSPKAASILEYGGSYAGAYLLRRGLFMPWELEQVMDREMAAIGLQRLAALALIDAAITPKPRSAFATVAALESSLYMRNQLLRDTDWASMAHSLEVRVPLVDALLLPQAAPFVLAPSKRNAKEFLGRAPSTPLPRTVVQRKKTGFMTPVETWLRRSKQAHSYTMVPTLAAEGCHWSRRWAYGVAAASFGCAASVTPRRVAATLV